MFTGILGWLRLRYQIDRIAIIVGIQSMSLLLSIVQTIKGKCIVCVFVLLYKCSLPISSQVLIPNILYFQKEIYVYE